jgi:hypothetical protein
MEADIIERILERLDRRKVGGAAPSQERIQRVFGVDGELQWIVLCGPDPCERQAEFVLELRPRL